MVEYLAQFHGETQIAQLIETIDNFNDIIVSHLLQQIYLILGYLVVLFPKIVRLQFLDHFQRFPKLKPIYNLYLINRIFKNQALLDTIGLVINEKHFSKATSADETRDCVLLVKNRTNELILNDRSPIFTFYQTIIESLKTKSKIEIECIKEFKNSLFKNTSFQADFAFKNIISHISHTKLLFIWQNFIYSYLSSFIGY